MCKINISLEKKRKKIYNNYKIIEGKDLMKKINDNKGITLVSLVITIIVILIITTISLKIGTKSLDEANIQNMKTGMLLIEAKTKEYVEDANFELGVNRDRIEQAKNKLNDIVKGTKVLSSDPISGDLVNIGISRVDIDAGKVYKLSTQDLVDMEIKGVNSNEKYGWYIVVFDIENCLCKIYNTSGAKIDDGTIVYSLDDIKSAEEGL